jgi:hemolysin III
VSVEAPSKPRFRGRLHQLAFFVTIPAGVVLIAAARTTTARTAAIVYALSLAGLYGSSASYHRLRWTPTALRRMKRLDHSMIFVLIAGTYTPFLLLVVRGTFSLVLLSIVWAGAGAGILLKTLKVDGLKVLTGALYVVLGWLAVVAAPQIVRHLSGTSLALLVAGGLIYTSGALVFATRWPNPDPATFGYHEVWHSAVFSASACHYGVILLLVLGTRS